MLEVPLIYKHYERTPLDCVYKALRNKDLGDCVVEAIGILKQTNNYIKFNRKEKSDEKSLEDGVAGKEAFFNRDYQKALLNYNMALMRASPNSKAMWLAYYSRAELLLKLKQFPACVKDVETCLTFNCPDSIIKKLREMKEEASRFLWIDQFAHQHASTPFSENFFKLKGARNPDIPCATSDVEVIMESGQPKVVAAKDIPVGTLVAVETAFVAATHILNHITSCHYCQKMDLNLMPCEGCCVAMFCDKRCKDKAIQDGHNIECKIMGSMSDDIKLPVKAAIKMRQLCSSWDEFITASYQLGTDRMENSSIAEIFGAQKFSLLNSHFDTHFIYGAMFNRCLSLANIIHYLDIHTSFLPDSPNEKSAAIHATSRVMMHLALYCTPVQLQHFTSLCEEGKAALHYHHDKGYFPFIGNLSNSCLPNSYVAGLRNSAALITIAPVKKGTELTFSYIGHWLEVVPTEILMRARKMFVHYGTVCKDCVICEGWADNIFRSSHLSDSQEKAFRKFIKYTSKKSMLSFPSDIKSDYKETCTILTALSDAPCSKEYVIAFVAFIQCLMFCVQFKFLNVIINRCD